MLIIDIKLYTKINCHVPLFITLTYIFRYEFLFVILLVIISRLDQLIRVCAFFPYIKSVEMFKWVRLFQADSSQVSF